MIKSAQKDKFSLPENITYLNTAYSAPLSRAAEKTGIAALKKKCNPSVYTVDDFFKPVEELKTLFARLIAAPDPKSIAIIPSVSYGIANVANNICLKANDEIVVVGEQFPSNVYSWKRIADKYGAEIISVNTPDTYKNRGKLWNEKILDAINKRTALVAMPNVHWADGTLFDLKAIRKKTTDNNALLIIDGTQSVGALPFSVKEIQPDAVICAGYKWLMGPYSIGLAYYGEHFNDGIPIEENWINRKESENFSNLVNYRDEYKEGANRYSVGEMSNFNLVPMLTCTVKQLLEWEPENIQDYCNKITGEAIEELREMHCFIEEDAYRAKHLFGVKLADNMDMERLQEELRDSNIIVSVRGNYIRVSPHVFNTKEDLEKLVNCFRLSISF